MKFNITKRTEKIKLPILEAIHLSNNRRITNKSVSCSNECNGCCKRLVTITIAEAVVIRDSLIAKNEWDKVKAICEKYRDKINNVSAISWYLMNYDCPVLIDEKCGAYEVRPIRCSTHFWTGNPKACDPWDIESDDVNPLDFFDIAENSYKKLFNVVDKFGILKIQVPIPIGLLMADRIDVDNDMNLEDFIITTNREVK